MLHQRKYIISAFLIFSFVFAGIYFIKNFSEKRNSDWCGTENNYALIESDTSKEYKNGKILFQQQCASCHILGINAVGPDLLGFAARGPWGNKKFFFDYLKDPQKFYKDNESQYVKYLYKSTPVNHPDFLVSEEEVDALIHYLYTWKRPTPSSKPLNWRPMEMNP